MINKTIAHYRILEKLGAGGMGEVYLAEDTKLDRRVALKFLPDTLSRDPEARERLLREAKATSRLNHPNILTVHSVELFDGRDYIVMEYVDGRPLDEFTRTANMALVDLLALAVQIGEGLTKAHQSGIIHRDIKPTNILVDSDHRARLLDFGLATYKGAARLTQTGSTLGTAAYMSPEQAMSRDCDHRADLFSLGVVLYEMITGRLPFRGEHSAALIYAIVNEQPEPLARYTSDAPEELQRVISKCLAKRPEERYQSAADLVADLRMIRRESDTHNPVSTSQQSKRKMLAVLPFENLGPAEDEYFADGITEEIISRLAAVKELGVISRTSVMQYKGTRKPIRDIGAELGADHILEGTVRWGKASGGASRVRITPQLIKVADDTHLWSDRYDRILEDIFDVQSDIAEQVTKQLNVTLLAPERAAINTRPTDNIEAYNAYLRGREYMNRPAYTQRNFQMAIDMFSRSVELDPQFALGWAELSKAHSDMFHHGYDQTPARRDTAKRAIDTAIALRSEDVHVHLAHGLYLYRCLKDHEGALREFERASTLMPNSSELWLYIGAVRRRRNQMTEALACLKRAFELDPRSGFLAPEIGSTLTQLHRYEEADAYFRRAVEMAPDQALAYVFRANNYLAWRGDLPEARRCLEHLIANHGDQQIITFFMYRQLMFERRYEDGLVYVETQGSGVISGQPWATTKALLRASFLDQLGRSREATESYVNARDELEDAAARQPHDHRLQLALAGAYAGLGEKDRAMEHGQRGVELCPVARDAISGTVALYGLAVIYAKLDEPERACDLLNELLEMPSWFSREFIRLDPMFDRMKGHHRFDALMSQPDRVF